MSDWLHRSQRTIAQGALTNSKHPKMLIQGVYPTHVNHGHGCHLYDANNRRYIDYICGLGVNLFGYGNDKISRELIKHIYSGFSHSLPTVHEVEAGEAMKEIFHFVERWKFLKSGSDACSAAIKIARNATKRTLVLSDGYHGWDDDFVSLSPPACGVPARDWIRKLESLEQITTDVAAVIIEPVMTDYSKERIEYLNQLRAKCTESGVILIFDEVITGFRFRKFSVSNFTGVIPDLIIVGKAMANGLPIAAVGGKAAVMDDPSYFISTTYAGEILSLISARYVCKLLQSDPDYNIEYLWERGQEFLDVFNSQASTVKISGYPTRGAFTGDELEIAIFFQEMAKCYVLFCKSWFYNWNHISYNDEILSLTEEVKQRIESGRAKLEYPMPSSPFSMGVRNGNSNRIDTGKRTGKRTLRNRKETK